MDKFSMWYVFYAVTVLIVIVGVLGCLGPIVMLAVWLIWCRKMDNEKTANKFKLFLKRHRMPPFHKDDLDNVVK